MLSDKMLFVLVLLFTFTIVSPRNISTVNGHNGDMVKRNLRWNANKFIVSNSSTSNNLKIDYLQPHSKSVGVSDTSATYMAFTLYKRNGAWIVPNTGVFHFTDVSTAASLRTKCTRSTNHAGAYYHFYGTCPSADSMIVASGWCYQGSNGLVFNSNTFNSAGATYMDGQYYLNIDRTVNSIERTLLSSCYNAWKNSGFQVNNWKCPTSNIPVTAALTDGSHGSGRIKRSSDVCNNCDCLTSEGSVSVNGRLWDSAILANVFYIMSTQLF